MENLSSQTLASIVTSDHRVVPVLESYSLDFCCKGKRTLEQACREKGLSVQEVADALEHSMEDATTDASAPELMDTEKLISHIILKHHHYVLQSMPLIEDHLNKVVSKHGLHFPWMFEVLDLFTRLKQELYMHLQKEERILFPRILELSSLHRFHQKRPIDAAYVNGPVEAMEHEHDHAGDIMFRIRDLTGNYAAPEGACTTFRLVLEELKAFEADLHQHVHLENNVLFPRAGNMLAEVAA